jgi:WD40 repeat protein
VAVSADGGRIVTGSHDKTARVWDGKTFAEVAVLPGHDGPVASVAVSADGARIATGSYDKTVRVWQRRSRAETSGEKWDATAILKVHTSFTVAENISVAISADGAGSLPHRLA